MTSTNTSLVIEHEVFYHDENWKRQHYGRYRSWPEAISAFNELSLKSDRAKKKQYNEVTMQTWWVNKDD